MLLASNRGVGGIFGAPDLCFIPGPVGPIPAPLVNMGMNVQAMPFSLVVHICMLPALNIASKYLMTTLDEAGTAGPMKLLGEIVMGSVTVFVDGMPAATLTCLATGNNMNCAMSAVLFPSIVNVFFCYVPSGAPRARDRQLDAADLSALHDELESGHAAGIGAALELDGAGSLRVRHVRRRSLAARLGLTPGDEVISVKGRAIGAFAPSDLAAALSPAEGEALSLGVCRDGALEPLALAGVQGPGPEGPVLGAVLPDGVGHVEVSICVPDLSRRIHNEIRRLSMQGLAALVLDLRGNPGGDVNAALRAAEDFLPEGSVLARILEDDGDESALTARGDGAYTMPVVVLVDRSTASAAELPAGCLQAHGRALVVGERTYGKGIAQRIAPAADGSGVVLARAARYRLPDGTEIEGVGLRPDVTVDAVAPVPDFAGDAALFAAWRAALSR